jgi:hypothetical protein
VKHFGEELEQLRKLNARQMAHYIEAGEAIKKLKGNKDPAVIAAVSLFSSLTEASKTSNERTEALVEAIDIMTDLIMSCDDDAAKARAVLFIRKQCERKESAR